MEKFITTGHIRGAVQFIAEAENEKEFKQMFEDHFDKIKMDLCQLGVFIEFNQSDTDNALAESKRLSADFHAEFGD